jgi:hypothetical protein
MSLLMYILINLSNKPVVVNFYSRTNNKLHLPIEHEGRFTTMCLHYNLLQLGDVLFSSVVDRTSNKEGSMDGMDIPSL